MPVAGGSKVAERFRKLADGMTAKIEDGRRPMTQNATPKRMREYRSRLHDANNLERVQKAFLALATAHEDGTIPASLAELRTKDEVYRLVYKSTLNGGYYDVIPSPDYANTTPEGKLLQGMIEGAGRESAAQRADRERKQRIELLEAEVQFANYPGYFPTPKPLAAELVRMAVVEPGMTVLEPSAGKGNIAEAVRERVPSANIEVCEFAYKLQEILKLKGFNVVAIDCLEMEAEEKYDRVIMNPPFEKGADMEHVMHTFGMLKPGGRLVAIMGEGAFFRSDSKAVNFRDWLEAVGGECNRLPENSFKGADSDRQTAVNTRVVVIDKIT